MNNKNIVTVMGYLALTSVFVAIAAFMFKSAKENRNYDVILGDKSNYSQTSFTSNELNNDIVLTSDSDEINSPINSSPTSTENVENNNENSNNKPQISDNQNNKTSSGKKTSSTTEDNKFTEITPTETKSTSTQKLWIDINTASKSELMRLNGIGQAKAESIIQYRQTNGKFNNIDEIKNVKGIGNSIFSKISSYIYVENPTYTSTDSPTQSSDSNNSKTNKININTADINELIKITGVGQVIAQRIIDYRNENGSFKTIDDIIKVKGIGEKTFQKMKEQITI